MWNTVLSVLFVLAITVVVLLFSWGLSVGIWYLVCLCFEFNFSWLHGTGIWLILMLVGSIVPRSAGKK